jgi:hypothetical protein
MELELTSRYNSTVKEKGKQKKEFTSWKNIPFLFLYQEYDSSQYATMVLTVIKQIAINIFFDPTESHNSLSIMTFFFLIYYRLGCKFYSCSINHGIKTI